MTTDAASMSLLSAIAQKCGSTLQIFQIRNDSRSGGTVGPMLSAAMGVRAIDAGIPQLSMHSIRATTGSLDPGTWFPFCACLFRGVKCLSSIANERLIFHNRGVELMFGSIGLGIKLFAGFFEYYEEVDKAFA
jgi:aminopeptidase I